MTVDSRKLPFFSSSSSRNNSNDVLGDYVSQEWMVATATSVRTSQEKSVLELAGTGLDDIVRTQNEYNNNKNFNLESSDSNGNVNGKNSEDKPTVPAEAEEELPPFYFQHKQNPPKRGYGPYINLSPEERELFRLLRNAKDDGKITTTLRVAGGWVRDKLLATPEFSRSGLDRVKRPMRRTPQRLTSKYRAPSSLSVSSSSLATPVPSAGRQGSKVIGGSKTKKNGMKNDPALLRFQQQAPVDIDIALDDMLGREFAEHLNKYLTEMGEKTHGVGVVLKNPEKSKHLETATMKVGTFWIDFVNLRAEEYAEDSRIPELMRIGTPAEDAFRRDLTINSLFYNVNNGQVEDWTGRGFNDLRRCVIATPLAPLTTLLDDPLRTLRSVRFAARLHFTMDASLKEAAMDDRVRKALAEKVSRERIGCEVDLMLRSPDPVGAMRLLINLKLAKTVFPIEKLVTYNGDVQGTDVLENGLRLLSITYDQLEESKISTPVWCDKSYWGSYTTHGVDDIPLIEDSDALRYMWYAAFLKPIYDHSLKSGASDTKKKTRKLNRSVVSKLLVDELKRPTREADAVEKIMKGATGFKTLMDSGSDYSSMSILLSDIRICSEKTLSRGKDDTKMMCSMNGQQVFTATENDPVWQHAMEFRLSCSEVIRKVGPLWRAALFLAMSEHITEALEGDPEFVIEGDFVDESQEDLRQREIERYDSFATAMQRIGLVGIWGQKPLLDGGDVKKVLPNIPHGPIFGISWTNRKNGRRCIPVLVPTFWLDIWQRPFPITFEETKA
eukprot:jgi/Psemu1/65334/estExt_Genemark1.C_1210023